MFGAECPAHLACCSRCSSPTLRWEALCCLKFYRSLCVEFGGENKIFQEQSEWKMVLCKKDMGVCARVKPTYIGMCGKGESSSFTGWGPYGDGNSKLASRYCEDSG